MGQDQSRAAKQRSSIVYRSPPLRPVPRPPPSRAPPAQRRISLNQALDRSQYDPARDTSSSPRTYAIASAPPSQPRWGNNASLYETDIPDDDFGEGSSTGQTEHGAPRALQWAPPSRREPRVRDTAAHIERVQPSLTQSTSPSQMTPKQKPSAKAQDSPKPSPRQEEMPPERTSVPPRRKIDFSLSPYSTPDIPGDPGSPDSIPYFALSTSMEQLELDVFSPDQFSVAQGWGPGPTDESLLARVERLGSGDTIETISLDTPRAGYHARTIGAYVPEEGDILSRVQRSTLSRVHRATLTSPPPNDASNSSSSGVPESDDSTGSPPDPVGDLAPGRGNRMAEIHRMMEAHWALTGQPWLQNALDPPGLVLGGPPRYVPVSANINSSDSPPPPRRHDFLHPQPTFSRSNTSPHGGLTVTEQMRNLSILRYFLFGQPANPEFLGHIASRTQAARVDENVPPDNSAGHVRRRSSVVAIPTDGELVLVSPNVRSMPPAADVPAQVQVSPRGRDSVVGGGGETVVKVRRRSERGSMRRSSSW